MSTKEMQFEEKTSCPRCDTVLLWHDAIGQFVCLRCKSLEDLQDTVNQAWEHDKL